MNRKPSDSLLRGAISIDREFVRSYISTSNKEKYYKKLDNLYNKIGDEDYSSRPRIIVQGLKSLDLRSPTPEFAELVSNWMRSYTGTELDVPEKPKPVALGIPRKQISKLLRHTDKMTSEQRNMLKEYAKCIPSNTEDALLQQLREFALE